MEQKNIFRRGLVISGIKRKGKPIIECNQCHKTMGKGKPKWKKAGDIEYYYLKCQRCKEVYVISATDTALRQDIKRFKEMLSKAQEKLLTDKELLEIKKLMEDNMSRNREIKEQYPLEMKPKEQQGK